MTNISSAKLRDLDGYVAAAMQDWGLPGLALAVVKDDEVVLAKGYGVREAGRPEAVDEHTLFGIGSNTKAFTATGLGLLVQDGPLDWDDPVIDYLPDLRFGDPYVTHALTVRDLLCHRSGLATYAGDVLFYGAYTRPENIRRLRYVPPAHGFRSRYGYSNLMFLVAGEVTAAAAGMSWEEFVRQRLLESLGMRRSTTRTSDLPALANVASPHTWVNGQIAVLPVLNLDSVGPAGSLFSSAWEMAQWLRLQLAHGAFDGQRLVDREVIEETRTPHTHVPPDPMQRRLLPFEHFAAYGLGWQLTDYRGRLLVSHGGHVDGMVSRSGFLPEEDLGVIVLTNDERNDLKTAVLYRILDTFLEDSPPDWSVVFKQNHAEGEARQAAATRAAESRRATGTRPTLPLEDYLGDYFNPILGPATVANVNGRLRLQMQDHPVIGGEIEHWHYDTFWCYWSQPGFKSTPIIFHDDGAGVVNKLQVNFLKDWIDSTEYMFEKR